jgi:hypothetical protein
LWLIASIANGAVGVSLAGERSWCSAPWRSRHADFGVSPAGLGCHAVKVAAYTFATAEVQCRIRNPGGRCSDGGQVNEQNHAACRSDGTHCAGLRASSDHHATVQADNLKWAVPAVYAPGAQLAVIKGDPTKEGMYVVRLKVPAGFKIPAHTNPNDENVTVLSGSFNIGTGDKLDEKKGIEVKAGGYSFVAKGMAHYACRFGGSCCNHFLRPVGIIAMCAVNGVTPAACGTLLMDTGVTAMYLTVPDSQAPNTILTSNGRSPTLVDGTKLTISIPTEAAPQALYSFTVGDAGNPLAPARLILVSRVRPPFVNTSVHFLKGFDYLYDVDGGFVGFSWTGHATPTIGKVVPSTARPANQGSNSFLRGVGPYKEKVAPTCCITVTSTGQRLWGADHAMPRWGLHQLRRGDHGADPNPYLNTRE